jgi:branched-subunit amino acid transport protein AzlD
MNFLNKLVTAGSGTSSMRAIAIVVVFNVMVVWTCVCFKDLKIADIPWGVLSLVALVLTGKVVQRFAEGNDQREETKTDNAPGGNIK